MLRTYDWDGHVFLLLLCLVDRDGLLDSGGLHLRVGFGHIHAGVLNLCRGAVFCLVFRGVWNRCQPAGTEKRAYLIP